MGKKLLTLEDTINVGRNKRIPVSQLTKLELFDFIKKGIDFDDATLEKFAIKRTIKNNKVVQVITLNKKQDTKVYDKETESLKKILKSLHTIDNQHDGKTTENEELNIISNDEEENEE